jgi:hypothetical protein
MILPWQNRRIRELKNLSQRHFVYDKYIRTALELNPRLIGERLDNVLMLQCCDSGRMVFIFPVLFYYHGRRQRVV